MKRSLQGFLIFFTVLMIHASAWANTCLAAVGGGNWSTAGTWTNCGGVAPTSTDDADLTALTGTLTIDCATAAGTCLANNVTSGAAGTISHAANKELDVYGNLTLTAGVTYGPASTTSSIHFKATGTGHTVTTAGKRVGSLVFEGAGGGWTLQDALDPLNNAACVVTHTAGTLDLNGQNVAATNGCGFSSTGNGTRTLTCGATTWKMFAASVVGWTVSGSNYTINCGSSTINLNATSAAVPFSGGGGTYGTISNNSTGNTTGSVTIGGVNASTLNLSQAGNVGTFGGYGYFFSGDITVSGTCTLSGNSALNRAVFRSSVTGTQHTLSCGTNTFTYINFMDIIAGGAGNWDVSAITGGAGDLGNNTGITFAAPKSCYMVNGGANVNWSASNWKTASNGSTNCTPTIPLPQDTAVIDSGWTGASKTLTIDAAVLWMPALDFTSAANTPGLVFTQNAVYTRDIKLVSGMTVSGTGQITIDGSGTRNIDITTAGQTLTPAIKQITGPNVTVRQLDNLTDNRNTTNCIDITSGIYRNNTFTTNCTGAAGTISISGGTFKYSGNMTSTSGIAVFALTSGHFTPDTGYYMTDLVQNQVTVAALPASGGSCTFGQLKDMRDVLAGDL